MARRRNGISEFFDGFNSAYGTVNKVLQDREIRKIATDTPEETQGFTAEQGADLEAAAKSGQYDIGVKTNDDGSFNSYTVTPKSDPSQVGTVAAQGVTDFMGQRRTGSMSAGDVNNARQMAMAGVMKKYGNVSEGLRLEQQALSGQRDEARFQQEQKRFGREEQRWAQEDEDRTKAKAYEDERKTLFSNTRFAQVNGQYQQQMTDYQQKLATYEADKAAGKAVGAAPTAPTRGDYSIGDALADRAALVDHDARYGKLDNRAFGEFTDMLNKVQSEGYEKALRLAQSGAPVQEVAKAFNGSGKAQFDAASVVSDKVVKGKDGVETRVIQFKDAQGNLRTINALAELDSLGKANDVFTRHYQAKSDARADSAEKRAVTADGRQATTFAQGQADRTEAKAEKTAKANAAVELYKQKNPGATPADLEAVRTGVLSAVPSVDKSAPAEVKLAGAYIEAGLASNMAEALKMATSKNGMSPEERRADIFTKALAQSGNAALAEKAAEAGMAYLTRSAAASNPGPAAAQAAAGSSGKVQDLPKVNSQADQAKLPKGTRYMAPDGSIRIKQ